MKAIDSKAAWDAYREAELAWARPMLRSLGYTLDDTQVHIGGERYLMSGRKLVLVGQRADGQRVVIKVSSDPAGMREISHERKLRHVLHALAFSQRAFHTPEEILYLEPQGYRVLITSYVEQDRTFLSHQEQEQFFLALRAFETQEGAHATTLSHTAAIRDVFGIMTAQEYLASFDNFANAATTAAPDMDDVAEAFTMGREFLTTHRTTIERYCGFLTHHDFVPHNLRVAGKEIYLLDHTSIHFGNKYESWARFLNYMMQYNPPLERALLEYVRANRGEDEYLSLRLMRIYKIGFLLRFYAEALTRTSGDLNEMTRLRLVFWTRTMKLMVRGEAVSEEDVRLFIQQQEALRSQEERKRQSEILGREKVLVDER